MSTITIHYQSPKYDRFKVPRPHRVPLEGVLSGKPEGGEIGELNVLLGLCPDVTPDPDDWRLAQPAEVADDPDSYIGWFAQFIDADGTMFGYDMPIERIEVTP